MQTESGLLSFIIRPAKNLSTLKLPDNDQNHRYFSYLFHKYFILQIRICFIRYLTEYCIFHKIYNKYIQQSRYRFFPYFFTFKFLLISPYSALTLTLNNEYIVNIGYINLFPLYFLICPILNFI